MSLVAILSVLPVGMQTIGFAEDDAALAKIKHYVQSIAAHQDEAGLADMHNSRMLFDRQGFELDGDTDPADIRTVYQAEFRVRSMEVDDLPGMSAPVQTSSGEQVYELYVLQITISAMPEREVLGQHSIQLLTQG